MPNPIIPKKSAVSSKVPASANLQIGEIAINLADHVLYSKDSNNSVFLIKADPLYNTGLQSNLDLKANVANPIFTGTVTSPTFTSTIEQGSAPFVVTSNTVVVNLNADLLDGQHGSFYTANSLFASHTANTSNPHSVTATQVGLGNVTNESKTTMFSDPSFTGNVHITGDLSITSSNLVTNLNADLLDGQHGSFYTANSDFSLHTANTSNPHSVTATQVGLGNVTNESKITLFTSPAFTGSATANNLNVTGTLQVTSNSLVTNLNADLLDGQHGSYYSPLDSPVFTGLPSAPTASTSTSNTQIASTAFVHNQVIVDKPLIGFASNNGIISSSDTILSAIQKLDGNDTLKDYIVFNNNATTTSNTEGSLLWDATYKTLDLHLNAINLQIGQEEVVLCYNGTANTIYNGSIVEMVGANGDYPSVSPAIAQGIVSALIIGMATEDIPSGGMGFVTHRGIIHDIDTHLYSPGTRMYLSDTVPGGWTNVPPSSFGVTTILIGVVLRSSATTGSIYVRQILNNRLSDLSDTFIQSPVTDQVLKYNGSEWVNGDLATISPGAGISFFPNDATVIPAGSGPQTVPMFSMSKMPSANTEVVQSRTVNDSTDIFERFLGDTTIGSTSIDAGIWAFENYGYVSSGGATSTIPVSIYRQFAGTGTVTITGSGTSRTATVTGNSPFISTDANTSIELASALQTTNGIFEITGYSNTSVVTVRTLSTYTNETSSAYHVHRLLFSNALTNITATSVGLVTSTSTQPAYVVNPTDKLSFAYFAKSTGNRTIYWYHNGTTHYSHVTTPLVTQHNSLPGLQGGNSTERYHLSAASYAVVQATSGINSGDQTNISGNAATATDADMLDGQHGSYYTANSDFTTLSSNFSAHTANTANPHAVTATQVGLGNVTNESKVTMFSSPSFTGTPTAPTAAISANNTQIATTQFVQENITNLISNVNSALAEKANTSTYIITNSGLTGTGNLSSNVTISLATSGVTANTYGSSSNIPVITVDTYGRITSATTSTVNIPSGSLTFIGDVTGSGSTGANTTLTLSNTGVTANTYGSSSNIPVITIDAKGRITSATTSSVFIPSGDITFIGDVTGSGSTGANTTLTLSNTGVIANTYTKVTVDTKGRITSGTFLSSSDLPAINTPSQIVSTVSTGTSPFSISSTTLNTNLNADLLDGQHGTYYNTADNLTGTISSAVLGNSSLNIGTTSIALNRSSSSQTLTGVSIDGNSNSVTYFGGQTSSYYAPINSPSFITPSLGVANASSLQTSGDIIVGGDLTVNGNTTIINTTTLQVEDKNIEIGKVTTPSDSTADGGGITLKGSTDKTIVWDSINSNWTSSEHWNLATDKTFKINNASILSSTTLGSSVVNSSLTSVGTITSGTWSGSFGAVSGANLTSLTAGNLTGTIPSAVLGNSSLNIGTTSIALNRASGSQTLTGVSIDGSAGSITGTYSGTLTSSQITTGLGFTPYNSTNPNGYITSSGSISGSAGSVAAGNITGTTLASNVTGSSLTSVGTLTSGSINWNSNITTTAVGYFGPASALSLTNPLLVGTNNINSYTQVQIQNTNTGTLASSDFIATADNGTDSTKYVDLGINNSGYNSASWTVSGANDAYLYVNGGSLTLGTDTANKTVSIHTGGTLADNIVTTFNAAGTTSSNTSTGSVVISGGLGVSGVINASSFSGTGENLTSLTAGNLSGTIPSVVLGNSSLNIGTTSIALNRASGSQTLTGVSIDGNSGTVTNGVYTSGSYSDPTWLTISKSKVGLGNVENTALSTWAGSSNITTVGTITNGTWSGSFGSVSGENLTSLTAGNLSGTIPSAVLGNSSLNIGTTSIALNRASGSQTLTGVSIDGSAATATTATNIAGGVAGGIHYQTGSGATSITAAGSTGQVLVSNGSSAPTWTTLSAGATISNNTSTNSNNFYPTMAYNATSGSLSTAYVSSTKYYFNPSTGTLAATIFNALSDQSVKINVKNIEKPLEIVKNLRGVEFDWKENNKKSSGVIAQELEKILPHLVDENSDSGLKSVNYSGLIGYLIESIKDQQSQIDELHKRLEILEQK